MAILAIFHIAGATADMYQALRGEVQWETRYPPGSVFHAAAVDEHGDVRVADVWESGEALQAFVAERLMPAMARLGMPPPLVSVFPAINVNAMPGIEPYVLR